MAWKDGKYIADSKYGMVGDIGNWIGDQVSGSTNPASRSGRMNSMVTGNKYVTGPQDRGVTGRNASPVSLAKPATVVAPAPVSTAPKGAGDRVAKKATAPKTSGVLKAPPPMVPANTPAAATAVTLAGSPEVMGVGIDEPQLEAYGNVAPTTIPGLAGFKDMNSYAQNDALYKAGLQESYTPDQLAQLEGLDTTSLANPVQSPGIGSSLAGAWEGIGGAKGLADLSGGLASLYSIYSGNEQNKRANEALNMQKAEYNRGVQKDKDFATAMNKSGLGTYSAGLA